MAPPPEYDKEPKAPDKSAASISCEETKALHNLANDQQTNSEGKPEKSATGGEVENNKPVETLDDGQLRALLDEAITYKGPKDREGKSKIFKKLLEEVEQDEQACEAAARGSGGGRRGRVTQSRGRRALPHSNSLQDLVAALAAEPAPRHARNRHHHNASHHHSSHHHPPPVSARAIHGGSLPSGVDTSFLLGEEPTSTRASISTGAGGYLATVRCVNPPPLAERRVSASDANCAGEVELLNRRSKPAFPTYTARATLEIGSGSVCSGRATTTTTASNQVRTYPRAHSTPHPRRFASTAGPPERLYQKKLYNPHRRSSKKTLYPHQEDYSLDQTENYEVSPYLMRTIDSVDDASEADSPKEKTSEITEFEDTDEKLEVVLSEDLDNKQMKLLSALLPKSACDKDIKDGGGSINIKENKGSKPKKKEARGPKENKAKVNKNKLEPTKKNTKVNYEITENKKCDNNPKTEEWMKNVNTWYKSLDNYSVRAQEVNKEENVYHALSERGRVDNRTLPRNKNTPHKQHFMKPHCDYTNSMSQTKHSYKNLETDKNKTSSKPNFPYPENKPYMHTNYKEVKTDFDYWNKKHQYDYMSHDYQSPDRTYHYHSIVSDAEDFIESRKQYRESVGFNLVAPTRSTNPRNVRSMTIGKPLPFDDDFHKDSQPNNTNIVSVAQDLEGSNVVETMNISARTSTPEPNNNLSIEEAITEIKLENLEISDVHNESQLETYLEDRKEESNKGVLKENPAEVTPPENKNEIKDVVVHEIPTCSYDTVGLTEFLVKNDEDGPVISNEVEMVDLSRRERHNSIENENVFELVDLTSKQVNTNSNEVELQVFSPIGRQQDNSRYFNDQQKLFHVLEISNVVDSDKERSFSCLDVNNEKVQYDLSTKKTVAEPLDVKEVNLDISEVRTESNQNEIQNLKDYLAIDWCSNAQVESPNMVQIKRDKIEQDVIAELPRNSYILLTLPNHLISTAAENDKVVNEKSNKKKKKKIKPVNSKKQEAVNKNALRALLLEQLFKNDDNVGKRNIEKNEVDSAIPFSCITTPEVVASCNTTSSTTNQSTVAVDPKPLQLASSYSAVTSLTGAPPEVPAPSAVTPSPAAAPSAAETLSHPRSVISSSFNGLPLTRPSYGSTASTTSDEFKKSLDENGNSVQGFSSPLSASSQHKKPRRKKSSKNETVITSHEINGYQGNKDLNEVLRFIESNAEGGRAHKLTRAKHKDDSDDKNGKKRSTERRKDKESKMKRATSMEELSRTKLEDLTDKPKKERRSDAPTKGERRSWGDDARDSFYFRDEDEAIPTPDADFQTVTKKRKPRKRDPEPDASAGDPPRPPRVPSPRARRVSAPPSDRSNDSNDDMDSVHSLHLPAPPTYASYADIARTRHNIPDLIESCNFLDEPSPTKPSPEQYPALEARSTTNTVLRKTVPPVNKVSQTPTQVNKTRKVRELEFPSESGVRGAPRRRSLQERVEAECPAPDVVADRRPPVILLDSAARPGDMDGVTFGFDINEQLLSGNARRPRCDLVRDAMAGANAATPTACDGANIADGVNITDGAIEDNGANGVPVLAGCASLLYVPPKPPADTHHLHQIIDYVGTAWEDVVRCGGSKVRYFSE